VVGAMRLLNRRRSRGSGKKYATQPCGVYGGDMKEPNGRDPKVLRLTIKEEVEAVSVARVLLQGRRGGGS